MGEASKFATTRWTLVLLAGSGKNTAAANALSSLCETYWAPVYTFVRRRGHTPDAARDLTQAFFTHLIEKSALRGVAPERGRFRSFLLASVKNFVANELDRSHAIKRGGAAAFVSFDVEGVESRLQLDPADPASPDIIYERQWALAILARVLDRLAAEFRGAADQARRFERLKGYLTGDESSRYAAVARDLGMSEEAVRVAIHRLRRRFGKLLRDEIAQTVGSDDEVDDELRYLLNVLSAR